MSHSWLVEIGSTHRVSTATVSYNDQDYLGLIDPATFSGAKIIRVKWDIDTYNASTITFDLINKNNTAFAHEALIDQTMIVRLINNGVQQKSWRFVIKNAEAAYQKIKIKADDFLSILLDGTGPNRPLLSDIWPEALIENRNACVPVIFGSAYVPLEPIAIPGEGIYFPMGLTGPTYSISELSAPHELDIITVYDDLTYTGSQSLGYALMQPVKDGSPIFWRSGSKRLAPLVEYSSSETGTITNIIDAIKFFLKDWGGVDDDFGDTWATVRDAINTRGDTFQGGYTVQEDRKKIFAKLCAIAHIGIHPGEKIEVYQLSKTPVMTIEARHITKRDRKGPGTFKYSKTKASGYDAGYVEFPLPGKPQDEYAKVSVSAKDTKLNISSETLSLPFVTDNQTAQRIGQLYFQRKFMKKARVSFIGRPELISLRPDMVVTINDLNYGGTYQALIDTMKPLKNSAIKIECIVFSCALDDWGDLAPVNLNIEYDPKIGGLTVLGAAQEFTEGYCEAGATVGGTWNDNITGKPDDNLLLNTMQDYDDIVGVKPDPDADKTTVVSIKTALDGATLITSGKIQSGLVAGMLIDFDNNKIYVGGDGVAEIEGDLDFLYDIPGVSGIQSYKAVKRFEPGSADHDDVVTLPGYWKGTPNINVSTSYGPSFHPDYKDRAQAIHAVCENLENFAAGQWRFTAKSFLRIEPTEVVLSPGTSNVSGSGTLPSYGDTPLFSNSSAVFSTPADTKRCKVMCTIAATADAGAYYDVDLQYQINGSGTWVSAESIGDYVGGYSNYYNSVFPTFNMAPCFLGSVSGKTAENECQGVSSGGNWWDIAVEPPTQSITSIQFRLLLYSLEAGNTGQISFSGSFSGSFLTCMCDGRDIINEEGKVNWLAWE